MKKHTRWLHVSGMTIGALTLGAVASAAWAVEFPEAELFFELNDSAGDLGIHSSIDGLPWKKLTIKDPCGASLASVWEDQIQSMTATRHQTFEVLALQHRAERRSSPVTRR